MSVSLHEIAPRLAAARDVRLWEISAYDDVFQGVHIRRGESWCETVRADHTTSRCSCGGTVDHYDLLQRLLWGLNKGMLTRVRFQRCRSCSSRWTKV